ncbi:hypothetical protein SAMN02910369_00936 [Lachnospiraceae bacterium NE2001]|nr:hypothetical protein SAMN02910369_00936 [Lachnospiraceae bacterium NE2001]
MKELEDEIILTPEQKVEQSYAKKKLYSLNNTDQEKSYCGTKYNADDLKKHTSVLTLGRTGGYSVVFLNLLNKKDEKSGEPLYTVDQLLDPTQLLKEKQETFDKIATTSNSIEKPKSDDPKNKKCVDLASTIYEGLKASNKIINELAEQLDVEDDSFIFSDTFTKMIAVSAIAHDAWQELCREFKSVKNVLVRKDHPELKDDQQCYDHLVGLANSMSSLGDQLSFVQSWHQDLKDGKDNAYSITMFVQNGLMLNMVRDTVRDWKKTAPDKKFTDYLVENDVAYKIMMTGSGSADALFSFTDAIYSKSHNKALIAELDHKICDGSLFKNVEITPATRTNPVPQFKYLPSLNNKMKFVVPNGKKKVEKKQEEKKVKSSGAEKKIKAPAEKNVDKSVKKKSKYRPIINGRGEKCDVEEVERFVRALKQEAGEIRGFFNDSPEYMEFYAAIDVVADAVKNIKKSAGKELADPDKPYKDYKKAVDYLKECAGAYEEYKLSEKTEDKNDISEKKMVNSDDIAKLKLVRTVKNRIRYFNLDAPEKKVTRNVTHKKAVEHKIDGPKP